MFAVLLLALAQAPAAGPAPELVNRAVDRGALWLIRNQYPDGSWAYLPDGRYSSGPTALAAYALLKAGMPREHRTLRLALDQLASHPPQFTYDAAMRCLLLTSLKGPGLDPRLRRASAFFLERRPGLFDYVPEGEGGDFSNTQFAMTALVALDRAGRKRKTEFWQDMLDFLLGEQGADGGWSYHSDLPPSFTMTLSGFAGTAACQGILDERGAGKRSRARTDAALEKARAWLAAHRAADLPAKMRQELGYWIYYAYYALERAMALSGRDRIKDHPWYPKAAADLLRLQQPDGSWRTGTGNPDVNTAFALLTLRRATLPVTGVPSSGLWRHSWSNAEDPRSILHVTAQGAPHCTAIFTGFRESARKLFTWKGELRPRVVRFGWFLDGKPLDADAPEGMRAVDDPRAFGSAVQAPRMEVRFDLPRNGSYVLTAKATIRLPEGGERTLLDLISSPLRLEVTGLLDEAFARESRFSRRNLLADDIRVARIEASSNSASGSSAPERAFDRFQGSRWLCAKDDAEPWIRLRFTHSQTVAALRLLPALFSMEAPRGYDQPTLVVVILDGKRPMTVGLKEDEPLPGTVLELKRPQRVREIEVHILERETGRIEPGRCGFREIEILKPDR